MKINPLLQSNLMVNLLLITKMAVKNTYTTKEIIQELRLTQVQEFILLKLFSLEESKTKVDWKTVLKEKKII